MLIIIIEWHIANLEVCKMQKCILFSFLGALKTPSTLLLFSDLIHNYGELRYQCQSNKINTFLTEFNNTVL